MEGKKRVLRLTKTSNSTTDELIGYLMQMQLKEKCPDGICGIYDFGLYSTDVGKQKMWRAYAVLEYAPNKFTTTLEGLEFNAKLEAFNHIFSTVECMMNNRYVHSDIKEDNMQFSDDKTKVIIFDFGMSRWQDTDCIHQIVGCTPMYASPLTYLEFGACLDGDLHSIGMTMFFHFYKIPDNVLFEMTSAILIDMNNVIDMNDTTTDTTKDTTKNIVKDIVTWALQARIVTMILPKTDNVGLAKIIKQLIIPKLSNLKRILEDTTFIILTKQAIITTEREVFTYNVPTFEQIIKDLMKHADDDNNYKYKFNTSDLSPSSKFEFESNVNFNDVNYIFSRILPNPVVTSRRAIDKIRNFFGRLTLSNFKLGFKSVKNNGKLLIKSSSSNKNMATGKEIGGGLKRRKISFTKINNVHTKRRRRHLKKLTYKRTS